MKPINFVETISAEQERAVQRWILISFGMLAVTIGIIAYVHIKQMAEYRAVCISCSCCAKTDADHAKLKQQISELQAKEKLLQEKLALFSKHKQLAQQTINQLKSLAKSCGADCQLQSFVTREQDVQMMVEAASSERASTMIAALVANKAFNSLMLVAMQPKDNGYLFTIKDHI